MDNSLKENEEVKQAIDDLDLSFVVSGKTPAEITAERGRLIRKIEQEIAKIKEKENLSDKDKELIETLEETLSDTFIDHRAQLDDRIDKEFIKKKADLKSLVTVLPKAVGLSVKKVTTCIDELKNAKGNKARLFKSIELIKSIGFLLGTPVIYTAKFIANHWYLILLLLALWKLPGLKKDPNNKNNDYKPQRELEPEAARDLSTEQARQEQLDIRHATHPSKVPVNTPEKVPTNSPVRVPTADEVRQEQLDVRHMTNPTKVYVKPGVQAPTAEEARQEQLDVRHMTNPTKVYEKPRVQAPTAEETKREQIEIHNQQKAEQIDNMLDDFEFKEGTEEYENFEQTINRFNERTNGRYYVREIAENQDVQFYNTPEEYLKALCEDRGDLANIDRYIDPVTKQATQEGYEEIYRITRVPSLADSRTNDIIFSDPDHKYLSKFQEWGLCKDEYEYFPMEARGFESVEDIVKALQSNDAVNEQLRDDFLHCLNTSELKEAINCLEGLGIIVSAGSVLPALTGESLAIPIEQLLANPQSQGELIDIFMKILKNAPELLPKIIDTAGPVLAY